MPFDVNKRNPMAKRAVNPATANTLDVDEWKRQMMRGERLPMLNTKPAVDSEQMETIPKNGGMNDLSIPLSQMRTRRRTRFGPQ